jgi:MFS family permease
VDGTLTQSVVVIAVASDFDGCLVGMAIGGLGFGTYVAVDLALAADVLPDKDNVAKDLGVFNIAGALPFAIAPAIAPAILAVGGGSYGVLYAVAGACALAAAVAVVPVKAPAEQRHGVRARLREIVRNFAPGGRSGEITRLGMTWSISRDPGRGRQPMS